MFEQFLTNLIFTTFVPYLFIILRIHNFITKSIEYTKEMVYHLILYKKFPTWDTVHYFSIQKPAPFSNYLLCDTIHNNQKSRKCIASFNFPFLVLNFLFENCLQFSFPTILLQLFAQRPLKILSCFPFTNNLQSYNCCLLDMNNSSKKMRLPNGIQNELHQPTKYRSIG